MNKKRNGIKQNQRGKKMQKVKVVFKNGAEKTIECEVWGKLNKIFWFNKTSQLITEILTEDKAVCVPVKNVLYVEDV
jgi:hypothetical protein